MKLKQLFEVSIIQKYHSTPIRDNETIRVYHGFNRVEDAILACTYGLSGKTLAQRIYSYEANNNPKGLFVTPDFKSAKEFGQFVIELNVKVSDLETPVWPSGSYTVQGQMSQNFKDDNDRESARLRDRDIASKSEYPEVSGSDRPEVADKLIVGGERQALFTGDLNSNSIRAVWVAAEKFVRNDYRGAFQRMKVSKFIEKFSNKSDTKSRARNYRDDANPLYKFFKPRDNFDAEQFKQVLRTQFKTIPIDELFKILADNPDYMEKYFWPRQMDAASKYIKSQLGREDET